MEIIPQAYAYRNHLFGKKKEVLRKVFGTSKKKIGLSPELHFIMI